MFTAAAPAAVSSAVTATSRRSMRAARTRFVRVKFCCKSVVTRRSRVGWAAIGIEARPYGEAAGTRQPSPVYLSVAATGDSLDFSGGEMMRLVPVREPRYRFLRLVHQTKGHKGTAWLTTVSQSGRHQALTGTSFPIPKTRSPVPYTPRGIRKEPSFGSELSGAGPVAFGTSRSYGETFVPAFALGTIPKSLPDWSGARAISVRAYGDWDTSFGEVSGPR